MQNQNRVLWWIGWVLTVIVGLMLVFSAVMKFLQSPEVTEAVVTTFGYSADVLLPLGIAELTGAILYLIPQTSVLGAIVLTGYLGGAIATHVRINDPFLGPAIIAIIVWLGIYLRDGRLRALLPFRR